MKQHNTLCKISLQKKKKRIFKNKLTQCVGKPKNLWKVLESLGLSNKSDGCKISSLAENQLVKCNTKLTLKTFINFYSTLAGTLLTKLPKLPN